MKIVTSATVFTDAVGLRISMTYSEVDETGKIIGDNKRIDRVLTDSIMKNDASRIIADAQDILDEAEK